jgi:hypothetical protein
LKKETDGCGVWPHPVAGVTDRGEGAEMQGSQNCHHSHHHPPMFMAPSASNIVPFNNYYGMMISESYFSLQAQNMIKI